MSIDIEEVKKAASEIVCQLRHENKKAHDNGDDYVSVCEDNRKVELGVVYMMGKLGYTFDYRDGNVTFSKK